MICSESSLLSLRLSNHLSRSRTSYRKSPFGKQTGISGHSTSNLFSDRPQCSAASLLASMRFETTVRFTVAIDISAVPPSVLREEIATSVNWSFNRLFRKSRFRVIAIAILLAFRIRCYRGSYATACRWFGFGRFAVCHTLPNVLSPPNKAAKTIRRLRQVVDPAAQGAAEFDRHNPALISRQ